MSPHSRVLRTALIALAGLLALTACSGPAAEPAAPDATGPPGTFPVAVEHKYGTTEITEAPQRVVTLGYTDPDSLLAVGVAPVGIVNWFATPPPDNTWPWQEAAFGDVVPEEVGQRDEYNLEKLAQLAPDLIVAAYSGMTRQQYEQVSQIAPTVAQPPGFEDFVAPWQVSTRHLTKAVGQEQRGAELVAQTEARIAEVAAAHPEWSEQTALATQLDGDNYAVFAQGDLKADLLAGVGFQAPPEIAREAAGSSDTPISPERASLLNVDKLFVFARSQEIEDQIRARPEFAALPVVREDRVRFLSTAEPTAAALGYGSVLSFPFALDQLVPVIEQMPPAP